MMKLHSRYGNIHKTLSKHSVLFVSLFFICINILIFNGILKGKILSNINYLYSFEPWIHLSSQPPDRGNFILSDMVDGVGSRVEQLRRIKQLELPLWDYSDKLGSIGAATILNDWFYPIRLFSWIIFNPPLGWTIEILLKFFFGSIFYYLYLRKIGINIFISIAVAIGFSFGANNISEHEAGFSTVPLTIPITLFYIENLFQNLKWKNTIPVIISGILLLSAGFISVSFFASFWLSLYVIARIFFLKYQKTNALIMFFFCGIFTVLIFSVALIPTIDFFKNGIDLRYRNSYGLSQLEPISLYTGFFANIFGHPLREYSQYVYGSYINTSIFVGFISFLVVVSVSVIRLTKLKDFYTVFFLFSVLFLLLNIYNFGFEHIEKLTNSLPLFNGNRPTYQKTIFQFFISILAGLNIQFLWNIGDKKKHFKDYFPIVVSVFSLLLYSIFSFNQIILNDGVTQFESKYFTFFSVLACIQVVILFLITFRTELSLVLNKIFNNSQALFTKYFSYFLGIMLILVFLTETYYNQRGWIPYSELRYWFPQTESTSYLQNNLGISRVIPIGSGVAVPAVLSAYGIPTAAGRGSVPEPFELLLQTAYPDYYLDAPTQTIVREPEKFNFNSQLWHLLDVKYFVTGKWFDPSLLEKYKNSLVFHQFNDGNIIELIPNPSHAYLSFDGVIFSNFNDMADTFSDNWDINNNIALFENTHLNTDDSAKSDNFEYEGSILNFSQKSNRFEVETTTTGPGYLLISSQYHPGWKAYVDGIKVDTFPAYGFLQAIKLESPGNHKIVFNFMPNSLLFGTVISVLSFFILIIFYILQIRKKNF